MSLLALGTTKQSAFLFTLECIFPTSKATLLLSECLRNQNDAQGIMHRSDRSQISRNSSAVCPVAKGFGTQRPSLKPDIWYTDNGLYEEE
jgi:hypothetical protein